MRALIFLTVIALANYYVSARLFALAPIPKVHFIIPIIGAAVFFGFEMLDLRSTFFQTYPSLKLAFSLFTGTFFCLIFYLFVADVILFAARFFPDVSLYKVQTGLFWIVTAVTIVTVTIGAIQAKAGPSLKYTDVFIKNLPAAFENYKIVQISDLHVGGTIRRNYVQNVVNLANEAGGDLIAFTGDFADGQMMDLKDDSALLTGIKSKDGIYFITGNHEYYHDLAGWRPYYKSLGFHVLDNRHEVIKRGDDKLVIAGVTDYSTRSMQGDERTDIAKAAKDMPQDAAKILLMHQPTQYKLAEQAGFDLQLSGHTHGGQFFPWTLVVPFFHDFVKGLGQYKNLQVYVSVGAGYWGPSLRTFMPAEISVLTLKKA